MLSHWDAVTRCYSQEDLLQDLVLSAEVKIWMSLCPGLTVQITVPPSLCVRVQTSVCLSPAPSVWTPSSPSCPTLSSNVRPATPAGSTETVYRYCTATLSLHMKRSVHLNYNKHIFSTSPWWLKGASDFYHHQQKHLETTSWLLHELCNF